MIFRPSGRKPASPGGGRPGARSEHPDPGRGDAVAAPRGAYAVLGLLFYGAGLLVVLLDALRSAAARLSLSWLWIACFSLGTLLMLVEFSRHWRRTLRPMSAALMAIGLVLAAIDLGGLMIRRLFLLWGWGSLFALAAAGFLTSHWLQRHHPADPANRSPRRKPLICATGNSTSNQRRPTMDENTVQTTISSNRQA